MIAFSVAAACSSKLKLRQKRLRSASPQARLMRLPKGEWITSCMPPDSSKKRSSTSFDWLGSTPSAARARARYSTICRAAASSRPSSRASQPMAGASGSALPSPSANNPSSRSRRRDTLADSSSLRPGASPSQNGMFGGWPWASSTRTRPGSTRRMR
ncbi:hypothetical protein FQZ97_688360 [compost metagenome]